MVKAEDFPEPGELVVCTVAEVRNFGAFATLDEYPRKKGLIHIAEVAPGWVKYIRDYVREGQKIVCKVLGVRPSRGHIDLSLKSVNEHQKRDKIQQWKNEKKAEKLFELLSQRLDRPLDEMYEDFGRSLLDEYESMYSAFEKVAINENQLKKDGFTGEWTEEFINIANENITPPYVQIVGYMNLQCPSPDGIEHTKKALSMMEEDNEVSIEVSYIGAPKYRVLVTAPDYKAAEKNLEESVQRAMEYIEEHEGEAEFEREE